MFFISGVINKVSFSIYVPSTNMGILKVAVRKDFLTVRHAFSASSFFKLIIKSILSTVEQIGKFCASSRAHSLNAMVGCKQLYAQTLIKFRMARKQFG